MLSQADEFWMYATRDGGDAYLDMAEDALSQMNLSSASLLSNYADVFDRTKKNNAECIFTLANNASETGGYQIYFCQPGDKIANLLSRSMYALKGCLSGSAYLTRH